eukprot:scaffold22333_cov45-Phaeocystis_antarctica.AAC.2
MGPSTAARRTTARRAARYAARRSAIVAPIASFFPSSHLRPHSQPLCRTQRLECFQHLQRHDLRQRNHHHGRYVGRQYHCGGEVQPTSTVPTPYALRPTPRPCV